MLLSVVVHLLQFTDFKFMVMFLLVKFQQAEVIRERTGFQVGHYCGEMGQDFWDTRRWQREFDTKQVCFTVFVIRSWNIWFTCIVATFLIF
jgi:endoribonuclease Dicer